MMAATLALHSAGMAYAHPGARQLRQGQVGQGVSLLCSPCSTSVALVAFESSTRSTTLHNSVLLMALMRRSGPARRLLLHRLSFCCQRCRR